VFARGEAAHLVDVDGNVYVDYALGMGPNILGHAPESVVRAVADTLSSGQIFAGQHPAEAVLAKRVQDLVPCAELIRFGVAGSEMVQAALRLARAATGRPKIVKFEGHYHGWFDTILVSIAPPLDQAGPDDAPTPYLPSAGQSVPAAQDIVVLPWNDLALVRQYLEAHAEETAALIMEPILCNTGVIQPRRASRRDPELCDRTASCYLRRGDHRFRVGLHSAQGLLGVAPDLAVFAKSLAGGRLAPSPANGGSWTTRPAARPARRQLQRPYRQRVAAALATLDELRDGVYERDRAAPRSWRSAHRCPAARRATPVQGLHVSIRRFQTAPVTDYRSFARHCDAARLGPFLHALQEAAFGQPVAVHGSCRRHTPTPISRPRSALPRSPSRTEPEPSRSASSR
jgi:glutamate-1-semialdehyde 2,1-aminomutase